MVKHHKSHKLHDCCEHSYYTYINLFLNSYNFIIDKKISVELDDSEVIKKNIFGVEIGKNKGSASV